MNPMMRLWAVALLATLSVGLAACGSDSSSSSSFDSSASSGGGPEEQTSFSFGYSVPTGQNPFLRLLAETAQSTAEAAGGEGEIADAHLDPATEVKNVNGFVSQGYEVVVLGPSAVPESVESAMEKAESSGAATIAYDWSFVAGEPEAPPSGPIQGQVNTDCERVGQEVADAINKATPSGAEVVFVGLPFPVDNVDFMQEQLEASLNNGSEVVARLANATDNAQGALGPVSGALAAHPDVSAIVTYNGPSALGAVQAVKSAGLQGQVDIYNLQLDTATAKALKDGTITAAWDLDVIGLGEALGEMISAAGSGEPESTWAKTVLVTAPKYTKDNIDSWEDPYSG